MYELRKDSYKVIGKRLYSSDGIILDRPAILVYKGIVLNIGDYNNVFKYMMETQKSMNRGSFEEVKLHLLNLIKYPVRYFSIEDACYVIRRCIEFTDVDFVNELVDRYGGVGFLEWFELEKQKVPIQTKVE